jgi:hypothetical protein
MNMAAHIIDEEGAEIALAHDLLRQEQTPPSVRRRAVLGVAYKDVAKIKVHPVLAHKAISEAVLASVTPDNPEFQTLGREVVAALVGTAPETPIETMLATQMIGMHNAVADSLRMARESSEPLRGAHLDHASRLSKTFAVLVEAFERVRNKGCQTVIVQHVRSGGQAIGVVNK